MVRRVRIFISHSSKYQDICDRLQLALEADGRHKVFVDRTELKAGQSFDETLRQGIDDCDLLIFMISPESVAPGSYALAELTIARNRWRSPAGRVLPVMVAPTPKETIPPYLMAVTILEPKGNVVAETLAAVEAVRPPSRRGLKLAVLGVVLAIAAGLAATGYLQMQRTRAEQEAVAARVNALQAAAQQLCEAGNHALAWKRYDELVTQYPDRAAPRVAREDCAMRWLRNIRLGGSSDKFADVVDRVAPALAEGIASTSGQRAADMQAHLGWGDHLRSRDGIGGLDPAASYRKALSFEPSNVYAHVFWAHYLMVTNGPIDEVRQHFAAALGTGRERTFVRNYQFAAYLYYHGEAGMVEAARVATDMRLHDEPIDAATRDRLWTYVYREGCYARDRRDSFMAAMHAPQDLPTFQWLYPETGLSDGLHDLWHLCVASLEEASGQKAAALAHYEALRDALIRQKSFSTLMEPTAASIKRLKKP